MKKKAFTLIELLVVIAIIGILATISVIALQNARAKSRDAKRAGDMKQVQTALELFFNDKSRYPTVDEWNTGKIFSTTTDSTSTYMQIIPAAPTPNDGACTPDQNSISYTPAVDGSSYAISFCLGNTTGSLTPGPKCLTPGGILDTTCSVGGGGAPDCTSQFAFTGFASCGDTGTYQGLSYGTVSINGYCVMTSSLNVGNQICGSGTTCITEPDDTFDCANIEKYCYDNDVNNCSTYGALYTWAEAMGIANKCNAENYICDGATCVAQIDTSCNFPDPANNLIQGACPTGWHLPSHDEYEAFSTTLGGNTLGGGPLKEVGTTHWSAPNTGATNADGFTAVPAGYRWSDGTYHNIGLYSLMWTATTNGNYSYNRRLWYNSTAFDYYASSIRNYATIVRCFQD